MDLKKKTTNELRTLLNNIDAIKDELKVREQKMKKLRTFRKLSRYDQFYLINKTNGSVNIGTLEVNSAWNPFDFPKESYNGYPVFFKTKNSPFQQMIFVPNVDNAYFEIDNVVVTSSGTLSKEFSKKYKK